jgi:polygalacturonase/lysophospholipase L1-like esterase
MMNISLTLAAYSLALGLQAGAGATPSRLPTLFLIGDSTVRNGDATGSNGQWGWGEPLVRHFDPAKITVINRAIGGRSSRTFLTEGRWDQVLTALKPGDVVIMQFGHNDGGDLFTGTRPRASLKGTGEETQDGVVELTGKAETVHTFGWYMRKYVREAKAKGAIPIVCSLVPRKNWKDGRIVRAAADYGTWAADVARSEGALFIDLNEIIAAHYDVLGPRTLEGLFKDDNTHTSAKGAELNAASVVEGLKALPANPLAPFLVPVAAPEIVPSGSTFDVRRYGARGDGKTVDSGAINAAIDAASAAGGGTVLFPAGTYLSYSIRLKSHVSLYLGAGATLLAAEPTATAGYDLPEPNEHDRYQDFGHSHWKNSLIWGIGVEDVSILGPGRIDGKGLTKRGPGAPWSRQPGDRPLSMGAAQGAAADPEATALRAMDGQGNKAIALKLSRNVVLRDFSVLNGGHFVLLATGVDNMTIDNLMIDTNRDGLDIDASRGVRISNVSVNSPNDDAIVLKSSYALGFARATENVVITNCHVSGYDPGTLLDGTFNRTQELAPDRDRVTGRIKFGTESNGGFKNITISNCTFDRSRGLALETVDGGSIEDITISNLTMRDVTTAPLFFRIGNRGRGPGDPKPGVIRRVSVTNITATDVDPRFPALIAGIPGHPVEDLQLSNIQISYRGGGTTADAGLEPPENETSYPEPSMFGTLPSYGFFIRHAKNVTLRDVNVGFVADDQRPAFALHDVSLAHFDHVTAKRTPGVPLFTLRDVHGLSITDTPGVQDVRRDRVVKDVIR